VRSRVLETRGGAFVVESDTKRRKAEVNGDRAKYSLAEDNLPSGPRGLTSRGALSLALPLVAPVLYKAAAEA
jgi:hypothetical protein